MICSLLRASSGAWIRNRPWFSTPARVARLASCSNAPKKLGPAVGIARVVDAIDADEDVECRQSLGPRQGERQKDGVPRGDVSDRNPVRHHVLGSVLGHFDRRSERTSAEAAEIDVELDVADDCQRARNPAGGLDLDGMPLAVADGQCVELEAGRAGLGQGRGRVEAAAQ